MWTLQPGDWSAWFGASSSLCKINPPSNRMGKIMTDDKPKALHECIAELEIAAARAGLVVAELDPTNLSRLLTAFGALNDAKKQLTTTLEYITSLHRKLSEDVIPEALKNAEIDNVTVAGKRFGISTRFNASIPEAKREEGFKWMREVGKCGDLIKESVNAKQLSSFIESYFEEYAALPPEEAVTVHIQEYTTVRKAT